MDSFTFDLLSNHKKTIKKNYINLGKKDYVSTKNKTSSTTQVLCNNIDIFNKNISKYNNNELNNILNIMIITSKNIIQHKKNINNPINNEIINNLKKLIYCVNLTSKSDINKNLKQIKIKSKKHK